MGNVSVARTLVRAHLGHHEPSLTVGLLTRGAVMKIRQMYHLRAVSDKKYRKRHRPSPIVTGITGEGIPLGDYPRPYQGPGVGANYFASSRCGRSAAAANRFLGFCEVEFEDAGVVERRFGKDLRPFDPDIEMRAESSGGYRPIVARTLGL